MLITWLIHHFFFYKNDLKKTERKKRGREQNEILFINVLLLKFHLPTNGVQMVLNNVGKINDSDERKQVSNVSPVDVAVCIHIICRWLAIQCNSCKWATKRKKGTARNIGHVQHWILSISFPLRIVSSGKRSNAVIDVRARCFQHRMLCLRNSIKLIFPRALYLCGKFHASKIHFSYQLSTHSWTFYFVRYSIQRYIFILVPLSVAHSLQVFGRTFTRSNDLEMWLDFYRAVTQQSTGFARSRKTITTKNCYSWHRYNYNLPLLLFFCFNC